MTHRALFLVDGPSDEPLGRHLEQLCGRHGRDVEVVVPDLTRMQPSPGRKVRERLAAALALDVDFSLVFVHRDAEGQDPALRFNEIANGVAGACGLPHVPVVPVRMTEAWVLLDEAAIREVAGNPNGTVELRLPRPTDVEHAPDPKALLRTALVTASGLTGRKLQSFKTRFSEHRRILLQRLDPAGAVCTLAAWQRLETDVARVMSVFAD